MIYFIVETIYAKTPVTKPCSPQEIETYGVTTKTVKEIDQTLFANVIRRTMEDSKIPYFEVEVTESGTTHTRIGFLNLDNAKKWALETISSLAKVPLITE